MRNDFGREGGMKKDYGYKRFGEDRPQVGRGERSDGRRYDNNRGPRDDMRGAARRTYGMPEANDRQGRPAPTNRGVYRGNGDRGMNRGPRVGAIYSDVPAPQHVPAQPMPAPVVPVMPPVDIEENEGLLVGRNPIREALKSGRRVEKLLVAQGDLSGAAREIIRMAREAGAVVQQVERSRLDQIYSAHQGMLAYVAAVEYSTIDDMFDLARQRGEDPFLILLDGVTDPHNVGAIIRSAECAGAHGVILPERRAAGLGPAAAKAAAGALSYMPIAREKNLNRVIDELKMRGVWVIGTAMDGEDALTADLTGPVALVIGSEGEGISRLTLEKCDRTLTLPMTGRIESLNASVAAGILMYEIVRARAK